MATIEAKVQRICVYSTGDSIRYRVTFDKHFDAIVRDPDDVYVDKMVDYIDFVPRVLIAQCLNTIEGLDYLYSKKKEQGLRGDSQGCFGAAELQVVLRGAKVTMERNCFDVGSEYTNADGVVKTHEHAGYNTSITDVVVTDHIQAKLDALIDKVLGL